MNPRVKYQYHQKLIALLANSYPFDKIPKIFSGYFTSDLDPTKYDDKIKFIEDQIEKLDENTIDTIARDHGLNPEIEDLISQIVGPLKSLSSKSVNVNKDRISMNGKQRHDICNRLIQILSGSTKKQVESLLHCYGLHEGHDKDWAILSDYIENVLVASDDEGIIRMEKDFDLGILSNMKTSSPMLTKEVEKNESPVESKKYLLVIQVKTKTLSKSLLHI